tara:strand:+ start:135 stop:446 length:312 start_codon:yes stop_codon:yes gene_type:complete
MINNNKGKKEMTITNIKVLNSDAKFFGYEKYDNGTIQTVDGNEIKTVIKRFFSEGLEFGEKRLKYVGRTYIIYLNGEEVFCHHSLNHKNNTITNIIRKIKGEK